VSDSFLLLLIIPLMLLLGMALRRLLEPDEAHDEAIDALRELYEGRR